ncbi:Terpene cyclase family member [Aspergillus mulundensis]|uniref:Terpene cyclase family member n=1 Tax=Aspergillus mulundensis TaxID=1810919 RepID=A0A3D8S4U0_9EURO|nr:Terpene cyclase family member [Aspergillus mulundensis]RDW81312.1 Terpene cyclase family member [Aspergillus mulundensis]
MTIQYALKVRDPVKPFQDGNGPFSTQKTGLDGWRLTVEEGLARLKWKYLRSDQERAEYPQDPASKFYLGLPTLAAERTPAEKPSDAILGGALYHSQVQVKELGCWAADLSCIFFVTPMLIIAWYITQATIDEACAIELVDLILNAQNPDGGWPTYCGEDTTLMGTVLVYVALRLIGLPPNEKALAKARACLRDMGGAVHLPSWAKFWLALLGLYKWEGTDPYPVEMWLLPEWMPISPWKWYIIPRQVYLAMSYLSTKQFAIPSNPLLDQIRGEIFVQPYEQVNFVAYREATLQRSRELRKPWPLILLNWLLQNIWIPWFRSESLLKRGLERVWSIIEESEKANNSVASVSVDCFLNMIAFYSKEGPDSEGLRRVQNASHEYLWMSPRGMQVMSIHGGHTWETAFAMQAYAEANLANSPELQPALHAAYKFLVEQQHTTDFAKDSPCHFSSRLGGWPFSIHYHGLACSDCTAEALKAILLVERDSTFPRLSSEHHLQLGVDNLIMIQNPSGGYSSFEPIRGSPLLEYVNGTEIFGKVMVEYDYTECTSSCIMALVLYRQRNPHYRRKDVTRTINRGVAYILSQQRSDGSWMASWGIACTYGAFFALEALACVGLTYDSNSAVQRGCDFLVKQQQADGGWGETMQSIIEDKYVQADASHTVQTAWACLALMHAGFPDAAPIREGIRLMISRQRANGEWPQEKAVGCGIVTCITLSSNVIVCLLPDSCQPTSQPPHRAIPPPQYKSLLHLLNEASLLLCVRHHFMAADADAEPRTPLSLAITSNPGIKHWALFIDAPNEAAKTTMQILGARGRYFPSLQTPSDPRKLTSLIELCPLCMIAADKIEAVKEIAYATRIRNEEADYSCQDYVLDVLSNLEREGVVDGKDEGYVVNKEVVVAKRESWE